MNGPSIQIVSNLLSYDADSGVLKERVSDGNSLIFKGKGGYLRVRIGGKLYAAQKVAWLLSYGEWPGLLDHINGDPSDNRLCNLRLATKDQNAQNRRIKTRYLSKCIFFDLSHPSYKKYRVRVQSGGFRRHIGWYETEKEARDAAIAAITKLHGTFAKYT